MSQTAVAIIQARMASSRLPGKVLMDIEGVPMLGRVYRRTRRARILENVIVATSTEPSDDSIVDYCRLAGIPCFRGSHFDVLDRYHAAARETGADIVIRITADCPLMDPGLIDTCIGVMLGEAGAREPSLSLGGPSFPDFDFVATRLPPPWKRTYPIGLDIEVCTWEALEQAWREARVPEDREHVMPYLYRGVNLGEGAGQVSTGISDHGLRIAILSCDEDLGSQRWTVDTHADLELVRRIYGAFGTSEEFSWVDVLRLLRSRPDLVAINAGTKHKTLGDVDARAAEGGPR